MFQTWSEWRREICRDRREISFVDAVLLVDESKIDKLSKFYLNQVLSQFIAEV